jgi:hypothetical protein
LGFFFVVLNVFPIMFPIAPHFISYCFVISSTLVTYISMIFFIFPLFPTCSFQNPIGLPMCSPKVFPMKS